MIRQIEQTDHNLKGLRVKHHTQIRLKVQKGLEKEREMIMKIMCLATHKIYVN